MDESKIYARWRTFVCKRLPCCFLATYEGLFLIFDLWSSIQQSKLEA